MMNSDEPGVKASPRPSPGRVSFASSGNDLLIPALALVVWVLSVSSANASRRSDKSVKATQRASANPAILCINTVLSSLQPSDLAPTKREQTRRWDGCCSEIRTIFLCIDGPPLLRIAVSPSVHSAVLASAKDGNENNARQEVSPYKMVQLLVQLRFKSRFRGPR